MHPSGSSEQKIVVTGGAGFIGSHLVDRLLADGRAEVVVFDNLSRGRLSNLASHQADSRLRIVEGDVRDAAAVADALRGAAVVFHLAAQSTVLGGVEDGDYTFATNVVGTFNVLRAAAGGGVGRLVFASSREVYGEPVALPVDEDHPLMALNAYGASKAAGEVYCRAFRRMYGLPIAVLRLANVYGPRDFGHAIPVWLEQAAAGRELHVHGGKQLIDFIWVGQAVEALVRAAASNGSLPPINVASGTGTRILDLARRIARLAQCQPRIKLLPEAEVGATRFVANVERMRQMLRIEPPLDPFAHLPSLLPLPAHAVSSLGRATS
ncbi:MAG: SDR family NAD(P)-dependent oxidoreductase [Chloroflexota bacterium]